MTAAEINAIERGDQCVRTVAYSASLWVRTFEATSGWRFSFYESGSTDKLSLVWIVEPPPGSRRLGGPPDQRALIKKLVLRDMRPWEAARDAPVERKPRA